MTGHGNDSVWLTAAELAERLRQPQETIRYWRSKGYGPRGVKMGHRVLYRRREVERWEAEMEQLEHGRAAS